MVNKILLILTTLFAGFISTAQSTNDFPYYTGGMDSLTKKILKNMNGIMSIDRESFMFFSISIKADGVIEVNEVFSRQDSTSLLVLALIRRTASGWKKRSAAAGPIILPVFFNADKDSDRDSKMLQYTVTSRDYERNAKPMEGLLLPPIVVTFSSNR